MFRWLRDITPKIVDEIQGRASILRGELVQFVKRHGHYTRADVMTCACIVSALVECQVRMRLSPPKAEKVLPNIHNEAMVYLVATVLREDITNVKAAEEYAWVVRKSIEDYVEVITQMIKGDYSKTRTPSMYENVGHAEAISLFVLAELQGRPTKETVQEVLMLYHSWAHIIFNWRKSLDRYLESIA